ncbi:unnamed protein product [Schistosoma margrebowiei]|uniref:Uncharacterized protein n=1 Tax=Schistosoma margrebowiei TaxID=48269 RepID=A0A183LV44_9TREM|nr:unnamed protein product [Schistosoma margrebowiei]
MSILTTWNFGNLGDQENQSISNGNEKIKLDFLQYTDKLSEFKITLSQNFPGLHDPVKKETTMEDKWKDMKEVLTSTCQEVLGLKKHHHKAGTDLESEGDGKEENQKTQRRKLEADIKRMNNN